MNFGFIFWERVDGCYLGFGWGMSGVLGWDVRFEFVFFIGI